ncbi:DNA-binding CsgD family transcriptional regulator [Kibdelosporangium banguiense]|uniref:DNA-binding CsgD family transcriptional regulator n=1 Tax=Kibdelosporangium banguiense TaxID=1365924 RepID=A0ABS4TJV0_9PSEU|nr:LuxR C-terminal-related transcriptional regulator [Kibdelosporangium banguiense]MBP2324636.1 DNA-binding CsgD family transcriptional regulator [Kibdelosporangium banguiense]
MWEGRALSARREIAALATAGLEVAELHSAAITVVEKVVPADLTCWASMDPDTAMISSMTSGTNRIPQQYEPLLANYEYSGTEPHTFATLARRATATARLSDLPRAEIAGSGRLNEVWRPLGLSHELRVIFQADEVCWGAAGLVRRGEFSDREVEFMDSVASALAAATRVAARCSDSQGAGEPAIVVVDSEGSIRAGTAAVESWRDQFDRIAPGRFAVIVRAVVASARASGTFQARVRGANGSWILIQASRLISDGDQDETVVTIKRPAGGELLGVLFAAYGLTARERDVCHEVIAGRSTSDIAARLDISAHTVQDHLKSVFGKVGVSSRGELVAKIHP